MAEGADGPAAPLGTVRLGTILDDDKVAPFRQSHDLIHFTGPTGEVHRNDGARTRGDGALDRLHGNVLRVGIHIREYRLRTTHHDSARGSNEGARRGDYLVPRTDAEGVQGEFEGERTVMQRDSV